MSPQTDTATDTTASGGTGSSSRAADAYQAARDRTSSAYRSARDTTSSLGRKTTNQISASPVAAVVGGFAVGALVAAVLPRTQRETEALAPVGQKLTNAARTAVQSATQAGKEQIDQIRENAVNQVGHAVVDAVTGSAQ